MTLIHYCMICNASSRTVKLASICCKPPKGIAMFIVRFCDIAIPLEHAAIPLGDVARAIEVTILSASYTFGVWVSALVVSICWNQMSCCQYPVSWSHRFGLPVADKVFKRLVISIAYFLVVAFCA